jgi:tungstate transport system ATP-binding protein
MIHVTGLALTLQSIPILRIPELHVRTGEILAIVGPNGAGKSSLLLSLALLNRATFREYRFDGRALSLPAETLTLRRQMATVFQEPLLLSTSVLANAAAGLVLRGATRAEAQRTALDWLERFGIAHLQSRPAYRLSGGEAQRVNLARAMAMQPKVLFLDEPFSSLDVLSRTSLLRDLKPLLQERETTALLVSHDVTEIAHLADRLLVLEAGQIVQLGTAQQVFAAPGSPTVLRMAEMARAITTSLSPLIKAVEGDHLT